MENLNQYWQILEGSSDPPLGVKTVNEIEFTKLKKMVDSNDEDGIQSLISAMYEGTGWILRNAASPELRSVTELARYSRKTESCFTRCLTVAQIPPGDFG